MHRYPVTPTPNLSLDVPLATTTTYYDTEGDPRLGLVHTITDALDRVTTFDYDDAGRESLRTLPDGTEVETFYYPDGKVETRTVRYAGPEGSWQLTTSTTYDEQGRVATVTAPGGQVTTTHYDELGRKQYQLTADSVPGPTGEEDIDRLTSWDYGDLGRTVRPPGPTAPSSPGNTTSAATSPRTRTPTTTVPSTTTMATVGSRPSSTPATPSPRQQELHLPR